MVTASRWACAAFSPLPTALISVGVFPSQPACGWSAATHPTPDDGSQTISRPPNSSNASLAERPVQSLAVAGNGAAPARNRLPFQRSGGLSPLPNAMVNLRAQFVTFQGGWPGPRTRSTRISSNGKRSRSRSNGLAGSQARVEAVDLGWDVARTPFRLLDADITSDQLLQLRQDPSRLPPAGRSTAQSNWAKRAA